MKPDDYTIALICSRSVEFEALRASLDTVHLPLDTVHPPLLHDKSDGSLYVLGRIGEHNVVINRLYEGLVNLRGTALVTQSLLEDFPSIRFALHVGNASGIPSEQHDIRLGDVVVGRPGRFLYGWGKTLQNTLLTLPPTVDMTLKIVLRAVAELCAQMRLFPSSLKSILKPMENKNPLMATYPGVDKDELFQTDFEHLLNGATSSHCGRSRLVTRTSRKDQAPIVHYGLIAFSDMAMKSAQMRDTLSREHGCICFSVDAEGLTGTFPCLFVRGICDYADSHEMDEWQAYASCTAAAYTKKLLTILQRSEVLGMNLASKVVAADDEWNDFSVQASVETLQQASARGHFDTVEMLLNQNADNTAAEFSCALNAASTWGYAEIVKLLLDRGADINQLDKTIGSALYEASAKGRTEMVKLLLDRGADFDHRDKIIDSALDAALAKGHTDIFKLLLDRGADLNQLEKRFGNPLYVASTWGHTEMVRLLLDWGAGPNQKVEAFGSALRAASAWGNVEVVRLLTDNEAVRVSEKGSPRGISPDSY